MSKTYCTAPFVHMNIANDGNVTPCCTSTRSFGNSKRQSLSDIWSGDQMEQFREEILGGKQVEGCEICYQLEDSGADSFRLRWNRSFILKYIQDPRLRSDTPLCIHVHFSNICNLKCRMCWHGSSSSWFNDAKKLNLTVSDKALITSDGAQRMVDQLDPFIDKAVEFYFAGGEPLMMHQHYELLQRLIDRGRTDAIIGYNSNMTLLHLKDWDVIELWKQFKSVNVAISIDEVDERTPYLREGSDFETIRNNAMRIKREAPNVYMRVSPTITLLNIFNVTNLLKRIVSEGICRYEDITLNIVQEPKYYNIRLLPLAHKKEIDRRVAAFIKAENLPALMIKWLKDVTSYMNAEDWSHRLWEFYEFNQKIDSIRSESFVDVFSNESYMLELYELASQQSEAVT
ncbi:twitch domain-containing radical SAM protein [Teredinibacter turnerae]|uniref:twitch domain-containing radical SAM protein n=1 Tax=Teredinibacter turnerae TaxID=2426 RepID=UPI0003789683|nr:twitch domain-containing radical SAM protein [Teredinibacter turnerae]